MQSTMQGLSSRTVASSSHQARPAGGAGRAAMQSAFLRGGATGRWLAGTPMLRAQHRTPRRPAAGGALVEANLFSRVSRIARSYITSVVNSAEDPEKILDQAVEDMQADLVKMRQAAAQVMASQKQLERKYEAAQETADEWYRRAELALAKGEEDLAREALKRKSAYAEQADSFSAQLGQQKAAVEQLVGNTRVLEGKLAEAKMKKDTLKARAASAKTSRQVNEMLGGMATGKTALEAFDKMEEKVMSMEAESEAAVAMLPSDNLEASFKELEGGAAGVDDELSRMKAKLGGGSSKPAELPAGRPVKDAIDVELEAMRRPKP